ncbi:PAS domain S-box protein [Chitinibacter fontanus]|uniref:histidine kinase n=1 Tax=Chitinibacter fontanus TaxID=1737446 RepID=A0A7D5Z2L0_9NEIS|nr:PAS domain-containing sensor histidine kinase [Chitinibacter fontanus]QLI80363.1 PAS domain S-box protein [Chitinibacter fontanus]
MRLFSTLFSRFKARWHRQWPWWLAYSLVLLVLGSLAFYVLQNDRKTQLAREAAYAQDLLWQEQELRVRLQSNQNALESLAYSLASDAIDLEEFRVRADLLIKNNPEILALEWVDANGFYIGGMPKFTHRPPELVPLNDPKLVEAIDGVATLGYPLYSNVVMRHEPLMMQMVPVFRFASYDGAVMATYSLERMLQHRVPWWLVQRYQLQLVDSQNRVLAPSEFHSKLEGADVREIAFGNMGSGVRLLAKPLKTPSRFENAGWLVLVVLLMALLIWALKLLRLRMQERQMAEIALQDEILFRSAMENSLVTGLRATDKEGRIIYVNLAFANMVGWSMEELKGQKAPLPFWAPEALAQCDAAYRAILAGQNPHNGFELRYMRKNGERFDVRLYSSQLVDGKGEHRGWMASINDITELKRDREALQQSRQQLRTVLEGLDVAVCVSDVKSGDVLYRNRKHQKCFPIEHLVHQAEGASYCWVSWRRSNGYQPGSYEFEDLDVITGREYQIGQRYVDWLDGRAALLEICADITERRQAEEETRLRNERLQHTARLVNMGELASSLAHELNQPLAAIASYSTACETMLYKKEPPLGKVQETLVKMTEQARRAGQIIRGIRQLVVKRASEQAPCTLAELIDIVVPLLNPLAQTMKVKIEVALPEPSPVVMGDAVMLEQVLLNLIKNGLEAMAETPVAQRSLTITARLVAEGVELRIADRGCGVADMNQLFQPFYTTKSEGMGMGLNICRSVIEQHKGHLWAEVNPGGGTQMCFRLPTIYLDDIVY